MNRNATFPEFPLEDDRLDDPRWRGASSHTDGGGGVSHAIFRGLSHTAGSVASMYLSWEITADPNPDPGNDVLYVGFASATDTTVIILVMSTSTPGRAQPSVPAFAIAVQGRSGGAWVPLAVPAWIADSTRFWLAAVPSGMTTTYSWAFQMWVPVSAAGLASGINITAGSKMFYTLQAKLGPMGGAPQFSWPRGLTVIKSGPVYIFPGFGSWGSVSLGGGCTSGIALSYSNVGTNFGSQIKFDLPPAANTVSNVFYARPTNNMPATDVTTGTLNARFRIANWGLQPDWNDIPDPSRVWTDVPVTPASPTNLGLIAMGGATATAANEIHGAWTLSDCQRYDYLNAAAYPYPAPCLSAPDAADRFRKRPHQCLLVELSSAQPYDFDNISVYRNMNFVQASTFSDEADVNARGLPTPGGSPRLPVWMYVTQTHLLTRVATTPTDTVKPDSQLGQPGVAGRLSTHAPPVSTDPRYVESKTPTYRVRGFYETGDSTEEGGGRYPILKAMTSFGYYVNHEGDLLGWRTSLEGANEVAPDLYRIAVLKDSVATIRITIRAVEHWWEVLPVLPWWAWLLLIVILLIFFLFFRRKPVPAPAP